MIRAALLAPAVVACGLVACGLGACGRSQGVSDQQLGSLVVEPKSSDAAIDLDRAGREPAELGRALARPYTKVIGALGLHTVAVNTATVIEEAGQPVSELTDHTTIENAEGGGYRAVYTNSADYGRETLYLPAAPAAEPAAKARAASGMLYLRPRYQRWHGRPPEAPEEPLVLRDAYYGAIAATWELIAHAAELTDRGAVEVGGRAGRKIEIKLAPGAAKPPRETLTQRAWREGRSVEALTGEVVLDAEHGAPLGLTIAATIGFSREGRSFLMKVKLDSTTSGIGAPVALAAPPAAEVVATPGRLREVDDRDFLLQGMA
ncbi:MAG: hypothetical protein M3680_23350, partial [Myxococcota bacterium]|nr:hypothetical protein [Myxococcota bacterium]